MVALRILAQQKSAPSQAGTLLSMSCRFIDLSVLLGAENQVAGAVRKSI
jgi:hypothetical protein